MTTDHVMEAAAVLLLGGTLLQATPTLSLPIMPLCGATGGLRTCRWSHPPTGVFPVAECHLLKTEESNLGDGSLWGSRSGSGNERRKRRFMFAFNVYMEKKHI